MLIATLLEWLMFVHIVAAMVWVGSLVALSVLATQALRSNQPDAVARFVGSLRVVGPVLFAPAMAVVRAAAVGDHGEATRQLRRWSWGMRLILLLLVVVTWDMVFKPWV